VAYLDGVVGGRAHLAHALPVENPEVVNALMLWFLAGATPAVDWPVPGRGP
jgi:hypothetical protein